ncbi:YL1 nuclear protein-domain-containing protein [Lipomyces arxii]|uniref:YL1 nuclear protein-domain-containing protein n=1 Tax=Lipomyces arxii TaxID=56418 RepID=UPI0034CE2706
MALGTDRSTSLVSQDSGSESEDSVAPVELLVAGREKRATAGNRLRSLLDVETIDENDETMGIFAETEDDDDFQSEQSEEEDEEDEAEEDDDEKQNVTVPDDNEASNEKEYTRFSKTNTTLKSDEVPDDEMFSDSSDSEYDRIANADESDAGEQELRKQEKSEKARKRKRQEQRTVGFSFTKPTSKKSVETEKLKAKAPKPARRSVMLQTSVRASARSHTVKNKEDIIQRLQEEEKRKADNFVAPKSKKKTVITQAERIQRAKLIEEDNVASLNKFFEQEVTRKKSQKAALFAQRQTRLGPFVRWRSVKVELPVHRQRRIVEELDAEEKKNFAKRALSEGNGIDDGRPEKRKYKKRVKSQAPEVSNSTAYQRLSEDAVMTDNNEARSTASENPSESVIIRAENSHSIDVISALVDSPSLENDRARREDSQMTEVESSHANTLSPSKILAPNTKTSPLKSTVINNELVGDGKHMEVTSEVTDSQEATLIAKDGEVLPGFDETKLIQDENKESVKEPSGGDKLTQTAMATPSVNRQSRESSQEMPDVNTKFDETFGPSILKLTHYSQELLSFVDFPYNQRIDAPLVRSVFFGSQAGDGRPPARLQRHICPISGNPAMFRDPVTGVCYSNLESFRIIRDVLSGGMAWNTSFGDGLYYGKGDIKFEYAAMSSSDETQHGVS